MAIKTTFESMGLRVRKSVANHILPDNHLTDISCVDYSQNNKGRTIFCLQTVFLPFQIIYKFFYTQRKKTTIYIQYLYIIYIDICQKKKELSQEDIEEIQSLSVKITPSKARKRFGIGTTRLYRIWRDIENVLSVEEERKIHVNRASAVREQKTMEGVDNILQRIEMQIADHHIPQNENKSVIADTLS